MRPRATFLLALVVLAACSGDDPATGPTADPSGPAGASSAAILERSRSERFDCQEVEPDFFPGCGSANVLEGYALTSSAPFIEVLDVKAYGTQLEEILGGVDASFSDDRGDGAMTILGVGTCGTADLASRSYHLVWTAGVSEEGRTPERLIGSFELTYDDGWAIGLWFLDTAEAWTEVYADPFAEVGCGGGSSPWVL